MRIRRRIPIFLAVLAVAAALAVIVVLRKHAPPEPARLLPSADGFVYIDLRWMRRANIVGDLPQVSHDPEYEQFIQATDFQFERDLDEAAVAIHYPSPLEQKAGRPAETRFSEVFVGKIQGDRLRAYLQKISASVENYHTVDIYSIPLEGRTLRVAILGVNSVAASNHPDPQVIQGIVERSRKLASPFGGPALLRQHYKHVPFASLAWAVFRTEPSASSVSPGSTAWSFLFSKPAVVVASVRYLRSVHFRAAAFTESEDEARHVAQQLNTFFSLFHTAEGATADSVTDPDVRAVFDSLQVEQQKDRTVLTAIIPVGFFRKALAEAPNGTITPLQPPVPSAPPAPDTKKKGRPHRKQ